MAIDTSVSEGIAEVVINNPPVNALGSADWFEFANAVTSHGAREDVNCMVIRAEGRGFQAGVDIKELAEDGTKIVDVNRGCYDSFAAVYDCPVPVISAVHGYCLGGGIGISGASDIVIASEDATFSLPEIDRGALGAATHLMRLFGMQKTRRMLYTGEAIDAQEALRLGGVESVVPREQLRDAAMDLAVDDQRVDHTAAIVRHTVVEDGHAVCIRIHLDHGQMTGRGGCTEGRIVHTGCF